MRNKPATFAYFILEVPRILILIFATIHEYANIAARYSRRSRKPRISQIIRAFFFKKKGKKSTKWSIFTLFVELFSRKSTFFRDLREYSRRSQSREYHRYLRAIFAVANTSYSRRFREYRDLRDTTNYKHDYLIYNLAQKKSLTFFS